MKIYLLPQNARTLIFDIDGTLYTNSDYVLEQIDVQIRHWASLNGMTSEEGRKKIADFRKQWTLEHDGKKISLGNTFTHFGISIETSIEWRNSLMHPENFLKRDEKLIKTLSKLSQKFTMVAVTNNPVEAARKTLAVIGIEKLIPHIVGLDTCKKSKPAIECLEKAAELSGCRFEECISIGDRYDIDLALPLEKGMGGILVDGAEDIYRLPELLCL
ncbi:MAG: HAD family hydrolase [Treponema sp.]|nr:HAD family hydrolase [Treponema sp.]